MTKERMPVRKLYWDLTIFGKYFNILVNVFSLNGLFLFAPDTINKVMSGEDTSGTVCELIDQSDNSVSTGEADTSRTTLVTIQLKQTQ